MEAGRETWKWAHAGHGGAMCSCPATGIWRNVSGRRRGHRGILPRAPAVAHQQIQPRARAQHCQPQEEEFCNKQQCCSKLTHCTETLGKVRRVTGARTWGAAGRPHSQRHPARVARSSVAGSAHGPTAAWSLRGQLPEVGSSQPQAPSAAQESMAPLGEAGADAKPIWLCFAHC